MKKIVEDKRSIKNLEIIGVNVETIKDVDTSLARRRDVLTRARIKQVRDAIPTAFEDTKRDENLRPVIREMDIQTLKMLDAVMRRHQEIPVNGRETSSSSIRPEELSERAINLYVSLVKGIYKKTVSTCCSIYTMEELDNISSNLQCFNEQIDQLAGNKNKKFYVAEKAMNFLKEVNESVASRLMQSLSPSKTMCLSSK